MSHAVLVGFLVLYQFPRTIVLEATEFRNTFFILAFLYQLWNIQQARSVIDCKVKAFHHTALNQCVHEEVIPASFLCQQITFKLATAFAFQLQQDTFFLVLRSINEHVPDIVMFGVLVMSEIFVKQL